MRKVNARLHLVLRVSWNVLVSLSQLPCNVTTRISYVVVDDVFEIEYLAYSIVDVDTLRAGISLLRFCTCLEQDVNQKKTPLMP